MMRLLARATIYVASSAIGILLAALILPGFTLSVAGFITAVLIFSIAQSLLTPFIVKMAARYASSLLGGIGLVSTYVALLISTLFVGGLTISGIDTWVLATLIVWLATALATIFLPLVLFRKLLASDRARTRQRPVVRL